MRLHTPEEYFAQTRADFASFSELLRGALTRFDGVTAEQHIEDVISTIAYRYPDAVAAVAILARLDQIEKAREAAEMLVAEVERDDPALFVDTPTQGELVAARLHNEANQPDGDRVTYHRAEVKRADVAARRREAYALRHKLGEEKYLAATKHAHRYEAPVKIGGIYQRSPST